MRLTLLIAAALICAAPAFAKPRPRHARPAHAMSHAPARPMMGDGVQRPVDVGPFTPEANRAYQGGGVSLPAGSRP